MNRGFTQIPNTILTEGRLSAQARLLYCILVAYDWQDKEGGRKGIAWPSQKTLAEEAGFSVKTIQIYLDELEACGLIRKAHSEKVRSVVYILRSETNEEWNPGKRRKSGRKSA